MVQNKILLVDDSKFFMRTAAALFQREGFKVLTATTGEDALRLAQVELPELILLALRLPKLDGMMVLRMIRGIPTLRETPVIILSGNNSQKDEDKARELGILDYFQKESTPISELVNIVHRSFGQRAS
jgi:two-component system, OmpR family, alkaline phosphatase synthesis response regulator PhoP